MAKLSEKIGYSLGDAAAGGITWKVMSIAFPFFFTNIFGLSVAFFFIPMDPAWIWVMIANVIVTSIGIGIYSPLLWSMYADVADYATEKNGTSSTGLIFSSGTMAQKFGSAVSGALVALLLGAAGLLSSQDPVTGETVVTITNLDGVQTMVWALFSLFPAAIALLILLLLRLYPIRK